MNKETLKHFFVMLCFLQGILFMSSLLATQDYTNFKTLAATFWPLIPLAILGIKILTTRR